MAQGEKSWEKRLAGGPDELAVDFVESLSFDRRLYKHDIAGSIAHAEMLAARGLITRAELADIKKGLLEIAEEIASGRFVFDKRQEDIHMAVEAALIAKIGDAGKKLHTGRSRNDQVATDLRLWMRDEIEILQAYLTDLQRALVKQAEQYAEEIMPAYTHLQRAQPVTIGAYLLSFVEMLARDWSRLKDCRTRLNVCPLGSGAVAGSTLPLDREMTAKSLGFADITYNSIDSVSDRDFCAEFIFCCSLIAAHLSRLAEDWILFATTEFGFIRIADAYCTSSSMMPQKRNPDMLELIRGKTGSVYGALVGMLTILKAQPSAYNRDLQEDKLHVFRAADVTEACVQMARAIVEHTVFQTKQIADGLDHGFLDATAMAEYLVGKGVPFREAHGIVGTLVAQCEKEGKVKLSQLALEQMQAVCRVIDRDVYDVLDPAGVCRNYKTLGAGGPDNIRAQVKYWKEKLKEQ
ncbi:MAG TPA: argininosuccinate lyase [Anaerohalosphaeraceae bacterium]|nr:argininosuccinate lyase [Anaerohalosphaeraceae bacterium]HOL89005.1 argininosuccinate lyase [Anaerohalosphaeraceae bacterium]HPP56456.1 argininosuccinate lyase [Anaerohalosphaeraceae bacterium]